MLSAFAVTVQVTTLMFVRKIGTVFVHHGYPPPLTHQLSHRICTDLKIDPGEGWGGGNCPRLPPVATPLDPILLNPLQILNTFMIKS